MSNYTKKEILEHYKNYFNNQKGQAYPCGNQIVTCAIITHDVELAERIMEEKGAISLRRFSHTERRWKLNNENWLWKLNMVNGQSRGYRFYKVIIDKNLSKEEIEKVIIFCNIYCCSFEVI